MDRGSHSTCRGQEHRTDRDFNTIGFGKYAFVVHYNSLHQSNFYSTLVTMKDDRGLPVFEVLEARAACDECIETLKDPSQCPHMQLERPKW